MKVWWRAIRPKTLPAAAAPVFLAQALAYQSLGALSWPVAAATLAGALLLQISANLVNDYQDWKKGVDGSDRLGPARAIGAGILSPAQVRRGFLSCFALALLVGAPLMWRGGAPIVIIALAALTGAWLYSAGPAPLSHLALGELAAFIFFGPVSVWGAFFLQTGFSAPKVLWAGCGPGFICAAIMGINNLRDRVSDQAAGKKTLAVLLGETAARRLVIACVIAACLVAVAAGAPWTALAALPFYSTWQRVLSGPVDAGLNACLAATGQFLALYCLLWSLSVVSPTT